MFTAWCVDKIKAGRGAVVAHTSGGRVVAGSNPVGPNMSFHYTNTFSGQLEEFIPVEKGKVNLYSCGPTVYDRAHIGNFRSYVFADLLRRALKFGGLHVEHAVNLTDIDDKTIKSTLQKNPDAGIKDLQQYTSIFITSFFEDLKKMKIEYVEHYPRATESIESMIDLVKRLISRGIAYKQDESYYFNISAFKDYGKLSKIDLSGIKTGTRYNTDEYDKEDVRDFVLWKSNKGEGNIGWQTDIGYGRPGWHLECSAMIHGIFGNTIDIHTGGVDLIFPHHENEIAQSRCAYDHDFVRYWMHCEHLLVDGKKMSKSLGNFYTLQDILSKGYDARALRYALMSVHYRQKMNFTMKSMESAAQNIRKIDNLMERLLHASLNSDMKDFDTNKIIYWKENILAALEDDLNIAKALAVFHEVLNELNSMLDANKDSLSQNNKNILVAFMKTCDSIFGFLPDFESNDMEREIEDLLQRRSEARKNRQFKEADLIRDQMLALGYEILDTAQGSRARKIKTDDR